MGLDPTPLLAPAGKPAGTLFSAAQMKARAWRIALALVAVNAFAITVLLLIGQAYPPVVPAGVLALSFGLRHAVDADHIAAIDNVTRRLIADGRQPLLTGLWFSLGHSSVVSLICVMTACGSAYFQEHAGFAEGMGAVVSTSVSAGLLFAIGLANLLSLAGCCGVGGSSGGDGGDNDASSLEEAADACERGTASPETAKPRVRHSHAHGGGLLVRCCHGVLRTVDAEWKMLLLGFLFGLGFETSSEVALLALAAMSPSQGIPPLCTLVLPLLFASGMSMVDTLDGLLMSWAYGFAAHDAEDS